MSKAKVVDQSHVRGALDEPDSEVARLILADAYEEAGDDVASRYLREPGDWKVDGLGNVRWVCQDLEIKTAYGIYLAKVRFGRTKSVDIPSMRCVDCKTEFDLRRYDGGWWCFRCRFVNGPRTLPGKEGVG